MTSGKWGTMENGQGLVWFIRASEYRAPIRVSQSVPGEATVYLSWSRRTAPLQLTYQERLYPAGFSDKINLSLRCGTTWSRISNVRMGSLEGGADFEFGGRGPCVSRRDAKARRRLAERNVRGNTAATRRDPTTRASARKSRCPGVTGQCG